MAAMRVLLALVFTAAASTVAAHTHSVSIRPLTPLQRHAVIQAHEWHSGCPVPLSGLRVLSVPYYGFDHQRHVGQLVVNAHVARPLGTVFLKLYRMKFPIRDMSFWHQYGPGPQPNDETASFECRDAVPSPCNGNAKGTNWSMHAYGEAVDLDPRENPYVGCGMTRDKTALSYLKRSWHRPGMVTPTVLQAFESIGWGWGGSWYGSTKDYMHFSVNGH